MFASVLVGVGVVLKLFSSSARNGSVDNARAFRTIALNQAIEDAVSGAENEVFGGSPRHSGTRSKVVLIHVAKRRTKSDFAGRHDYVCKQRIQKLSHLLAVVVNVAVIVACDNDPPENRVGGGHLVVKHVEADDSIRSAVRDSESYSA